MINGLADIGSVELDPSVPQVTGSFSNVTAVGGTSYALSVTYIDNAAIDVGSLDFADIRIGGPNGFNVFATFQGVDVATNGTPRIATYSFAPPGGTWDAADCGVYTVSLEPNQVVDVGSTPIPPATLGTFAYNLIRSVMTPAASTHDTTPEQISFKGTMQTLAEFAPLLVSADDEARATLWVALLEAIASHRVGDRPNRVEPRAKKRRPKAYPLLRQPRHLARKQACR